MEDNNSEKKYSYGRRPLWHWIVLYVVLGGAAYGLVYYLFFAKNGVYNYTSTQYQNNEQYNVNNQPPPTPATDQKQTNPTDANSANQNQVAPVVPKNTVNTKPATLSLTINNFNFIPNDVTVHKGTTVTWKNLDSVSHTVTGYAGGLDSAYINNGSSYSYTFTAVGIFKYYCALHPEMIGVVKVID